VTTEEIFNVFKENNNPRMDYFRDISTFGGCTAGPAAALANMKIIEDENLLENVKVQGEYLLGRLHDLKNKYQIIGDVRGKGLFCGFEMVKDRVSKEPVDETVAMAIGAHCMKNGVIIGRTNRSFKDYNNTVCLSPALIATKIDIDHIVDAIDNALAELTPNS